MKTEAGDKKTMQSIKKSIQQFEKMIKRKNILNLNSSFRDLGYDIIIN